MLWWNYEIETSWGGNLIWKYLWNMKLVTMQKKYVQSGDFRGFKNRLLCWGSSVHVIIFKLKCNFSIILNEIKF